MSRLAFGPRPQEMEVTDIATGHFVFRPVEGQEVSYEGLNEAIENAGYEIEDATIEVSGTFLENRHLETPEGQRFHLEAADEELQARLGELAPGARLTVRGAWKAVEGAEAVVVTEIGESAAGGGEGG